MAEFQSLTITGVGTQQTAPSAENHLVRLRDVNEAISGLAIRDHSHTADEITDLISAFGLRLSEQLVDSDSLLWNYDEEAHELSGIVRLKSGGALASGVTGLYVVFGTTADTAARGDHTHSGLHPRVTVQDSVTIALSVVDQLLEADAILAPQGGLMEAPSGLAVDFGTEHDQVARGDHDHEELHPRASVFSTDSLQLWIGEDSQILSGIARRDPAPGPNRGKIGTGTGGLHVVLGTGADEAAAGNHSHSAATSLAAGFLSAADKVLLDALVLDVFSGVEFTVVDTDSLDLDFDPVNDVLSGVVRLDPNPPAGYGRLASSVDGLRVVLGTTADTAAAGNHTHEVPSGTGFRSIVDGEEEATARRVVNADVHAAAAIAESKLALAFATHSNANDPSSGEKAALAGSYGTPGGSNAYVTETDPRFLEEWFDVHLENNGSALAAGVRVDQFAPCSGVVTGWLLVAEAAGSLVVDVSKADYSSFPTDASIAGSEKPTLSGARINRNLTVSTWSAEFGPQDVLVFQVESASGINRADLQLRWRRI